MEPIRPAEPSALNRMTRGLRVGSAGTAPAAKPGKIGLFACLVSQRGDAYRPPDVHMPACRGQGGNAPATKALSASFFPPRATDMLHLEPW